MNNLAVNAHITTVSFHFQNRLIHQALNYVNHCANDVYELDKEKKMSINCKKLLVCTILKNA